LELSRPYSIEFDADAEPKRALKELAFPALKIAYNVYVVTLLGILVVIAYPLVLLILIAGSPLMAFV
jgi:hypothetical protein